MGPHAWGMQIFIKSSAGSERFEAEAVRAHRSEGPRDHLQRPRAGGCLHARGLRRGRGGDARGFVPMLGGKQHGSLARAGKVRGQTPKVEKQDKKKKVTGRAKRRIQYNRRFVNAVGGQFAKKGPNNLAMQQMRAGVPVTM